AMSFAERRFGPSAGLAMAIAVALSSAGSVNGSLLAGSRVAFAAARDGLLPGAIATVHARSRVPVRAIVCQSLLAALIVIVGNFESLLEYFAVAGWLFFGLTALSLIQLRRKSPELPRPYRVPAYPWLPIAFATISAALLVSTAWSAPRQS